MGKRRKKKVTLARVGNAGRGVRTPQAGVAAGGVATAEVVVDNPYYGPAAPAEHRTIRAVRSLRDPLAKLHHSKRIDEAEYRAARRLQALLEAAEVGHVRSVDTAREGVDGGEHMPRVLTERQLRAIKALSGIWPLLGKDASALVVAVLQQGRMPEEYARLLGLTNPDDLRAMGRHFKWTLATLARRFGLVG